MQGLGRRRIDLKTGSGCIPLNHNGFIRLSIDFPQKMGIKICSFYAAYFWKRLFMRNNAGSNPPLSARIQNRKSLENDLRFFLFPSKYPPNTAAEVFHSCRFLPAWIPPLKIDPEQPASIKKRKTRFLCYDVPSIFSSPGFSQLRRTVHTVSSSPHSVFLDYLALGAIALHLLFLRNSENGNRYCQVVQQF